jgi:hypothetical protein
MSTHREAEAVLATWREIERSIERAEPGSPEFERLASEAALLRDEYQRLVAVATAPVSPSLPGDAEPA